RLLRKAQHPAGHRDRHPHGCVFRGKVTDQRWGTSRLRGNIILGRRPGTGRPPPGASPPPPAPAAGSVSGPPQLTGLTGGRRRGGQTVKDLVLTASVFNQTRGTP